MPLTRHAIKKNQFTLRVAGDDPRLHIFEQQSGEILLLSQYGFRLFAIRFAGEVIQREADIRRHFNQQIARILVKRIGGVGIKREAAHRGARSKQGQRGDGGPTEACSTLTPGDGGGIMLEILAPERPILTNGGAHGTTTERIIGI